MRSVFADTWFWLAFSIRGDRHHARAVEILHSILDEPDARLETSDVILAETLWSVEHPKAIARMRSAGAASPPSRLLAREFRELISSTRLTLLVPERTEVDEAFGRIEQFADARFSFPDCLTAAMVARRSIRTILTGDADFLRLSPGTELIPGPPA